METNNQQAHREKANKPRFSLIPADGMTEVAKVFTEGAKKYGDHDWENIEDPNVFLDAMGRHFNAVLSGEENDPETNLDHIAHLACNCLMYLHQSKNDVFADIFIMADGGRYRVDTYKDEDENNHNTRKVLTVLKEGHNRKIFPKGATEKLIKKSFGWD